MVGIEGIVCSAGRIFALRCIALHCSALVPPRRNIATDITYTRATSIGQYTNVVRRSLETLENPRTRNFEYRKAESNRIESNRIGTIEASDRYGTIPSRVMMK